jgi:hypothetical protein
MDVDTERKKSIFKKVINLLSIDFELVNMSSHAKHVIENGNLKLDRANSCKALI